MLCFVNPPLMALSGGFTPIGAMPKWIQPSTYLNPIVHFAGIASVLVGFSAWKFRGQMS